MGEHEQYGPTEVAAPEIADTLSAESASEADLSEDVFAPGAAVGDRYRIIEMLGAGGMGAVYRAADVELEREVALKTLHLAAASPLAIKRLRREIKLAVRINHPNVIRVYDLEQVGRLRFMTMEVVEGPSLKQRLARGHLSVEDACEVARQIAQGLAAAHHIGVVHRDLKPGNVLLGPGNRVVVADFGVAGEHTDATSASAIVGTAAYMPPEQANGEAASPAADIYALGIVVAEMLTGRVPLLGGGPLATAMRRLNERPTSLRADNDLIPEALDELVVSMLDPDPERRPSDAEDVARRLGTWASDDGGELAAMPTRSRRLVLWTGLVLIGAVGIGAMVSRWPDSAARDRKRLFASADDQLRGVWDPARRAAVAAQLSRRGSAAPTGVLKRLDGYAGKWRAAYAVATDRDSSVDEGTRRVQRACLGRLRDRLAVSIDILVGADDAVAPRTLQVVSGLEPVHHCMSAGVRGRVGPPVPEDPTKARRVEAVRKQLPGVWALVLAGKFEDAAAQARKRLSEARDIGYEPLVAESLYELARALSITRHPRTSSTYRDALSFAQRIGYDTYVARSASDLLGYSADIESALDSARSLVGVAKSALDRLGDVPALRANYHLQVARLAFESDDLAATTRHVNKGLALAKEHLGARTVLTMRLHALRGGVAIWSSLFRDAARAYETVVSIAEEVLGPDHPVVAHYRSEWSWPLVHVGDCRRALRQARRSERSLRGNADGRRQYSSVLGALANALTCGAERKLGEARVYADQAAKAAFEFVGAITLHAEARSIQARVARLDGRLDDALAHETDSLRLRRQNASGDGSWVAESLFYLGLIHLARKDFAAAQGVFDKSLSLLRDMEATGRAQAYPLMGLGLVQLRRGEPAAALPLLEMARKYQADGQMMAEHDATLKAALAKARKAVGKTK